MSRPTPLRVIKKRLVLPLLSLLVLPLAQCEKKPETQTGETTSPVSPITTTSASRESASVTDYAGKLGFISRLTNDTEFYWGTVQLKDHLAALQKTVWWKDANAFLNDKTPAPSPDESSLDALRNIWGDDVFLAGGPGFSKSVAALLEFNHLYQELNFKTVMAGTTLPTNDGETVTPPPAVATPLKMLQSFISDAEALNRFENFISSFTLPPLIFGVKTTAPKESLAKIVTPEFIKDLQDKKIVLGDLKTPDGFEFKTATLEVKTFLTDEWRNEFLNSLNVESLDNGEAIKPIIEKVIDTIRSKKVQIAWGAVADHIILASGENLDHLKFSGDVASSLLGKPEVAGLFPHAEKDLLSVIYSSASVIAAANDKQPFVPMLRGVVSAMKENATFNQAGTALEAQVNELASIESKLFHLDSTDLIGAIWWDKGLHANFKGGPNPKFLQSDKPLNYARLLDQKDLLFGITYHENPENTRQTREWLEKIVSVLYAGTKELLKSGIGGPQSQQQFAFFEALALPTIQKVYAAEKEISQKGMGNETAVLVDLSGKPPTLPGVPQSTLNGFIRISTVNEVANREIISTNWDTIYTTVNSISALLVATSGAPAGTDPFPITETPGKNGFTSWTIGGDFLQGDVALNATISDKHLILGTSPSAADSIAATISEPAGTEPALDGCAWMLNVATLTGFIESNALALPNQTPEKAEELKHNLQWIKPFKMLEGRIHQQGGTWHRTFDWDIQDIISFD